MIDKRILSKHKEDIMIEKAVKKKLASIYKEAKTRNRLEVPELLVEQQLSAGDVTSPKSSLSNKSGKKRSRSSRAEASPRPPRNTSNGNRSKNGQNLSEVST